jgi:cytochrome c-type biogenesis protein CcmE
MNATMSGRPPATRKRRRLYAVLAGLTMLGIAAALVLTAFQDSIVFFYSPTDLTEKDLRPGQMLRLGGLVEEGSVKMAADGVTTEFIITDLNKTVAVRYAGLLPDLFREGQGVVSQGKLGPDGVFVASEVLAKHDENYMPPEVAEALKKSGQWKEPSK